MKDYLPLRELSSIYTIIIENYAVRIQPPKMVLLTLKSQPPTVLPISSLGLVVHCLLVRHVHNLLVVQN